RGPRNLRGSRRKTMTARKLRKAFLPTHLLLLVLTPFVGRTAPPPLPALKKEARELVRTNAPLTQQMVDSIFSFSELGFQETETSAYVKGILDREGFTVTQGASGSPPSLGGSGGSGSPFVGFRPDIDVLPKPPQNPGGGYPDPLIPGGPGPGEGHNAGQGLTITAAIAVKQLMQKYQ